MPTDYLYDDGTVSRGGPRKPGEVNSGYLDEVYGLPPIGSDGNPMNMPAMRLDEDIGSGQNPMNMEGMDLRDAQGDSPAGLAPGESIDDIVPPRGPLDTVNFGDMTPPSGGGLEKVVDPQGYSYWREKQSFGPGADMAPGRAAGPPLGAAPRKAVHKVSSSAAPETVGGPPPGVIPPSAPRTAQAAPQGAAQWDEFMEQPAGAAPPQGAPGGPDMSWASGHVPLTDEDEAARQAGLSPRDRVLDDSNREFRRQQIGIDGMAAAAAKQRVDAERNLAALDTARKKTMAEIDAIKKRPGWLASRSSGQKILLFADAAFSGMLAAFQGSSKNSAIDAMHQSIEEDAEQRAQELAEAHGGMVDAQEMFKFKELARLRSYEDAKQHVLIQMQKYDPRGSMVAQGMAQLQDFDARQAEAETKILEHNWKKQLDLEHIASEERMKQADLAQEERASRRAAGVQYAGQDKEMLKAGFIKGPDGKWMRDPSAVSPMSKDAADIENTLARTRNVKLETQDKLNALAGPGGNPYAFGDTAGNPYVNKDGKVFAVKDDFRRQRISQLNTAAGNVRRMADLVKIMREQGGGASSAVGSPEYQELSSLAAQTDFETYKAFGLGAPSAGDQRMATAARGGKDITSFIYNSEAGFQTYAEGLEDKLDREMRDAGYTGKKIKLPRSHSPTEEELSLERARHYSPGSFVQGSKYRDAAEEGAAENPPAPPASEDEAPPGEDEDPWEKARRGYK